MPIVTLRFPWSRRPAEAPPSLMEFFRSEAGMSMEEVFSSCEELVRGKPVEVYFDLGENSAAKAFCAHAAKWGLEAGIDGDEEIEKKDSSRNWLGRSVVGAIVLLALILQEPGYGVILLVLGALGFLSYRFVRSRERK